jgi:hypothetical protein
VILYFVQSSPMRSRTSSCHRWLSGQSKTGRNGLSKHSAVVRLFLNSLVLVCSVILYQFQWCNALWVLHTMSRVYRTRRYTVSCFAPLMIRLEPTCQKPRHAALYSGVKHIEGFHLHNQPASRRNFARNVFSLLSLQQNGDSAAEDHWGLSNLVAR